MTDTLSRTFAALADPTRRSMLDRLTLGVASVSELAAPFSMTLPSASRHLKVLEEVGLISKGRHAQTRPCRIEPALLQDVDEWLKPFRRFYAQRLDMLSDYLDTLNQGEGHGFNSDRP